MHRPSRWSGSPMSGNGYSVSPDTPSPPSDWDPWPADYELATPEPGPEPEPEPEPDSNTVQPTQGLQSQPMAPTTSTASNPTTQENGEGENVVPYGTRSRNRTVGSRPNYAEDKEFDMEIEANGRIPKSIPARKHTMAASLPPETENPSAFDSASVRRGFAAINGSGAAPEGNAPPVKDSISETSTISSKLHNVAPVPAASKKRKQAGGGIQPGMPTIDNFTPFKGRGGGGFQSRLQHETNMMTFERCGARLTPSGDLKADDGTTLAVNDHAYFVCEPPGEPYYLARIMEFLHARNEPNAPIEAVRVNWYYRPKDIQRRVQDTRVVFASMHSDTCPLTSLRGKCRIRHLSTIHSLDDYRVQKDSFWFDKLYDRYIHRYYEVTPTDKVINVPQHVKRVLDERWKYVLVEIGRGKELTSAVKTCKKCSSYAANHDSVDCAVCKHTYHMACIRPPLLKKPARGFAWACASCSRAQEKRLEARHTSNQGEGAAAGEDEALDEEEDDPALRQASTLGSSPAHGDGQSSATAEQAAQANLWPYRYLGVHCRVEDALDYDDRIYPRASSRLGPRHQANVNVWHGRPVELVKPSEIKRKYMKTASHKKDAKFSKETLALLEADKESKLKRPKWVMDEPIGYVPRGEDHAVDIKGKKEHTAHLIFRMPEVTKVSTRGGNDDEGLPEDADREKIVDDYMHRVKLIAPQYNILDCSTDFLTKAVEKLCENNYNVEKSLAAMKSLHLRPDLKQPDLNKEEIKRFEEGVAKYGSELHSVARHVGANVREARIVRFYYQWKKTDRGRQIWGNYEGRKSKKESKKLEENKHKDGNVTKLVDDVADDQDDSAFDSGKAAEKKRGFECKFCATRTSRQWRRAPGTPPGTHIPRDASSKNSKDRSSWLAVALCGKCAYLWRRYAIQFESIEEVSKKIAAAGGRASKRRIDEELMRTIVEAQQESGDTISSSTAAVAASAGVEVPSTMIQTTEPLKKKAKSDRDSHAATPDVIPEKKKVAPERPPEPAPLKPEPPRVRTLPCAICYFIELPGDELLNCRDCRLAVHKSCYGVNPERNSKKWVCDMCSNDRNMMVSTNYECVLCPVTHTSHELMEPPKVTHKKKTDREREKERKEKEMVEEAVRLYRQQQEAAGRPANPREALKRTAWNNWVHVTCALWTPEIKFGRADLFEPAEGVGFIPPERYAPDCKICQRHGYPTVKCYLQSCNHQFHVQCAHQAGFVFGFDVTPIKATRKDVIKTAKLGDESGVVHAAIWCKHHAIPTIPHSILEATAEGITAMQLFAQVFKQVDQSTTGTVRRAAQFVQNNSPALTALALNHRRASLVNGISTTQTALMEKVQGRSGCASPAESLPKSTEELHAEPEAMVQVSNKAEEPTRHVCVSCKTEFSPKWWPVQANAKRPDSGSMPLKSSRSLSSGPVAEESTPVVTANPAMFSIRPRSSSVQPVKDHYTSPSKAILTLSNGTTANEASYLATGESAAVAQRGYVTYQCHKCHFETRCPPPISPPISPTSRNPPILRASEPVDIPPPHYYQAPTRQFTVNSYLTHHPNPPSQPASSWPAGPTTSAAAPGQTPASHSTRWRGEAFHGGGPPPPSPQINGVPQGPAYGHSSATPVHLNGYASSASQPAIPHGRGPPQPYVSPRNDSSPHFSTRQYAAPPASHHGYQETPSPPDGRPAVTTASRSPQITLGVPRSFPGPAPERLHLAKNQSVDGHRPSTPAEIERPGSSRGFSGASASPNLRNLLS